MLIPMILRICLVTLVLVAVSATAFSNYQQPAPAGGAELRFTAPADWLTEQPSSRMRVSQYKLPKAEGDKEDASLVIYYFGPSQGGSVSANIDRWISQMQQPDGSAAKDKAKTETFTVNGLKVSTVDLEGTYTAEVSPGSSEHHNDPNYRLRAAVIETPKGLYYLKLIGPKGTVARWGTSVDKFIKSLDFK